MKNLRVEYHNEVTINLGNFENQKPGFGLSADVEEGEDPKVVARALKEKVDFWLEKTIDSIRNELNS
jgi:phosphopantetheine adenylyltransferase